MIILIKSLQSQESLFLTIQQQESWIKSCFRDFDNLFLSIIYRFNIEKDVRMRPNLCRLRKATWLPQPRIELKSSGLTCQFSEHWAIETRSGQAEIFLFIWWFSNFILTPINDIFWYLYNLPTKWDDNILILTQSFACTKHLRKLLCRKLWCIMLMSMHYRLYYCIPLSFILAIS